MAILSLEQDYLAGNPLGYGSTKTTWKFVQVGEVPPLSRDGSVHATDEVFNAASHLAGAMFSLLGAAVLVVEASAQEASTFSTWKIVSFSIYGSSLCSMFVASTLHHSISASESVEEMLRTLDYAAIYPLIAGTLTPLSLVFDHGKAVGWIFFGVAWFLAFFGMALTILHFRRLPKWMSMTIYVSLGWLVGLLGLVLFSEIGSGGIALLALGGVFYTTGGVIFSIEKPNPVPGKFGFHEIWHLFVLCGASSHWCLMFFYVLPYMASDA